MATEEPNAPQSLAPTGTDEQQSPAEQGGAPLVDIEKDAVSPELGGKGSRPWSQSERQLLNDWTARITAAHPAHSYLRTQPRPRNLMLWIPAIALTAALGTG